MQRGRAGALAGLTVAGDLLMPFAEPGAALWRDAARGRVAAALGDHPRWIAIADRLAAFFFAPGRPPLRLSDAWRIAGELDLPFEGERLSGSRAADDAVVALLVLGDLTARGYARFDPVTGRETGAVPEAEVAALLARFGHPEPEAARAKEALRAIDAVWRAVAPMP